MQYSYDEDGQSLFFILTGLLVVLVPWTWIAVRVSQAKSKLFAPAPCPGWSAKSRQVKRFGPTKSGITISRIALVLAWAALCVVAFQASKAKAGKALYDPFAILGIRSGMAEKEIKRHYRKLSLQFHPDKLTLAENQTKEEADSHFVELTKAYKALTDEVVRKNFEEFGHPDGKQEYGMGIAIPSWIVDSKNTAYVMGVYALIFGLVLPYLIGRWWWSARAYTKDSILNETASVYFREIKEDATFADIVAIISAALELRPRPGWQPNAAFKSLEADVEAALSDRGIPLDSKALERPGAKRAAVLLYAHMLRLPIADDALQRGKRFSYHLLTYADVQQTVSKSLSLAPALGNFALAYSWLTTYLHCFSLQARLQQAVHPSLPSSLQVPHLKVDAALRLAAEQDVRTVDDFLALADSVKTTALSAISPQQRSEAELIARNLPRLEIVDAAFKVVGERIVTPGSIVQLIVRVQIVPADARGQKAEPNGSAQTSTTEPRTGTADVLGAETEMSELLGRKKAGEDGERKAPAVHAPLVAGSHRPTWQMLVADHKLERIFVPPTRFVDIGPGRIRTLKVTFQAPPNPGLYTFQTYVISDSYIDMDVQRDMKLRVDPPNEHEDLAEDDISDPEEDTLAGQLAMMKGQSVKKITAGDDSDSDDDDESSSGSEEEQQVLDSDDESD